MEGATSENLSVLSKIILVGSSIRLFADDRVAYRIIKSTEDHDHEDLNTLVEWIN